MAREQRHDMPPLRGHHQLSDISPFPTFVRTTANGCSPPILIFNALQRTTLTIHVRREVDQIHRTINSYRKTGERDKAKELRDDSKAKLRQRKRLQAAKKRLRTIKEKMERTKRNRLLTPEQKRERLDKLQEESNLVSRRAAQATQKSFQ